MRPGPNPERALLAEEKRRENLQIKYLATATTQAVRPPTSLLVCVTSRWSLFFTLGFRNGETKAAQAHEATAHEAALQTGGSFSPSR